MKLLKKLFVDHELKRHVSESDAYVAAIHRVQAVIEFTLDGFVLDANVNFCAATGYSLDEIRGKHHSMFVDPVERESTEYKQFWISLGYGLFNAGQFRRVGKNGNPVWLQASYNPVLGESGQPIKVVKFATDITAQKIKDHDAAGQVAAVYRSRCVMQCRLDGTLVEVNDNFVRAIGYSADELVGKNHSMLVEQTASGLADNQALWVAINRGESPSGQFKRLAKDGREVWFQANYNCIFDIDGKPMKSSVFLTDITEQLKANQALQRAVEYTQAVATAAREGDLTQRIALDGKAGSIRDLCDAINAIVDNMAGVVTRIKGSTEAISSAAREIASGNSDLSARTEQQAASLEETASSMEELTSTVKQNADNARQANQLAIGAADVAKRGGQVVGEVVDTMSAINDSSKKIVDIISVIDGIAFQTNILALNAAVEAARAGEQGRGFAVVAAEVRSLAQRSAGAAKEIKGLIGDSVEKVGNGTRLVEQAGRTMEEIVTSVKRVTDIMSEISAASQEQSRGIEQINQTVTQMDEATQQNAALVEEASAAARSLEDQAAGLSESIARFKLDSTTAKTVARPPASVSEPQPIQAVAPPVHAAARSGRNGRASVVPAKRNGTSGRLPGKTNGAAAHGAAEEQWTEF